MKGKDALLLLRVGMLALCVMPQTYTESMNMIFATKKARQVGMIMTASGDITAETMLLRGCRYLSRTRQKVRNNMKTDDKCKECKKDWTKCSTCPVMMKWLKEQKVRNKG